MPRVNLEGYEVRVIDCGGVIPMIRGNFTMTSYRKILYKYAISHCKELLLFWFPCKQRFINLRTFNAF